MENQKKYNWKFKYENGVEDIILGATTKQQAIDCAITLCKFLSPNLSVNTNSFKKQLKTITLWKTRQNLQKII
jgi:hypothetical protein